MAAPVHLDEGCAILRSFRGGAGHVDGSFRSFLGCFWANIAATALCALAFAIFSAIQSYRETQQINALVKSITTMAAPPVSSPSMPYFSPDPRIASEAAQAKRPRRLASNQRCAGGVVILVDGSSYTQTGERCSGSFIVP
ncbi:hypothetical protein KR767_16970 [Luteibacter anthropi]|uniref:hypothetical protein n=1 Tax=Luteibacter anthropi TaxID=564369 RepID=UPI0020327EFC|nr:hypothetical protein [Luteibacter anthropi]URX61733.1 hypothetical protein KR767_16970 [Luteibacter anthropi]